MLWLRRAPLLATAVVASLAFAGCASITPASSTAPTVPAATPAATKGVTPAPAATTAPTATAVAPTQAPTTEPSTGATSAPTDGAITTPVPGSSLDVTQSDAGIAGRITIPDDTRNDWTGTHEILGREADASNCSFSLEGDEFTAVAWYDDAPNGMLHQLSVTIPADKTPANAGEQRAGITDGSVYADFVSESGFGTAYGGAQSRDDGSSSTIDVERDGDAMVFTFTATTWDGIDFSGQMVCAHTLG